MSSECMVHACFRLELRGLTGSWLAFVSCIRCMVCSSVISCLVKTKVCETKHPCIGKPLGKREGTWKCVGYKNSTSGF